MTAATEDGASAIDFKDPCTTGNDAVLVGEKYGLVRIFRIKVEDFSNHGELYFFIFM